ncbi:glycosyltransferase [Kamptonema sp. PCC 6506]|uniref:glycosyltransferase n=1 Tax=Kamptonema sp. PCC 6506 TaxID=272129 RepID=UPI0001DAD3DC|nr:glycosyltransferase [Kamptonema sp. PCC 6506]CBN58323.1 glycosyl transferase, group 1 [Kamptonema sp. PCC 6506]
MNVTETKSSVFIIAGMHRSGTSLTASLLQKVGVNIGENLVGPAYGNVKGHFENVDFVEFHKAVLCSQGIDDLGSTLQTEITVTDEYVEQAQNIIRKSKGYSLWGWKDPRTTLFLNFWLNLLPDANVIFVYRSPWEVVDSLYRRATDDSLLNSPEIAVKMWIHYNRKVLAFHQQYPERCFLAHVYAIGNKANDFVETINSKFHVDLPAPPPDNFEKSLLVNEILQTHRPSLINKYFPEALELYSKLEEKALNLGSGIAVSDAEFIKQSSSQSWVFQDWLEIRQLEKQKKILKSELKQWQEQFSEAQGKVRELENELGSTQVKLAGTEAQFQEALAKVLGLETELGSTQVKLAGTEAQFQEALAKVLGLENELGATQVKLAGTEAQFQEALAKVLGLETELGSTQVKLAGTEAQFQEALAKVLRLETELGSTQGVAEAKEAQLQEIAAQFAELETELGSTKVEFKEIMAQIDRSRLEAEEFRAEIAAIKSSKLWKIREKWFDLKRRLRDLSPRFFLTLDAPASWNIDGGNLEIAGWLFHNRMSIKAVRARIGEQSFEGVYGIGRGDVGQSYPHIPSAVKSGFRIEVKPLAGRQTLLLEAQDSPGKWHLVTSYSLSVSTIQAAFDSPVEQQQRQGQILFAGWCCHPEQKITNLTLYCGDIAVDCAYGLRRKDVNEAFPDWVGSYESGFEALVNLPPGEWPIALQAQLENGEVLSFHSPKILTVARYNVWQRGADKLQEVSRFAGAISKRMGERKQRLGRILPMPWEIAKVARQVVTIYRQQKQLSSSGDLQLPGGFVVPQPIDTYDAWLDVNQWNERAREYLISRLELCQEKLPKISVVMPVYNPPIEFLEMAITSVTKQVYQDWELCIADDCSTDATVAETLKKLAQKDSRIRLAFRTKNGNISAATNSAAELATGDFILFLDNDDELTPDALGEVALYLAAHPETDFLYSDDDKIDTEGHRFCPQFKPDWSPELLLSYMYLGHLCVVRSQIFEKIGGLRLGFEGSQDYDFALRATEVSRQVGHLPLVLYHWRTAPGSTAISGAAKPASFGAGQKAIQEALERRKIAGSVYQPDWASKENLGIFSQHFPDNGPAVTIIIPTKNQLMLLKGCLDSLKKTTYQNYQVVAIDNESDDPKTLEYLNQIHHQVLRIKNEGGKFSFAAINNRAVEKVESEYILFLNNDTEVINPRWLSQMVGYAQVSGVGAVGARLLYPDSRIQHAGIIHGLHHGLAGHAFKLMSSDNRGYLSLAMVTRNYSAVTAACMLTPRNLFLELGGFDEQNFAVAYNDVDYGYRLLEQGYRSVYCPDAELLHREGTSRGFNDNPQEVAAYRRKYARKVDDFYSPHLSLDDEYFRIQPRRFFLKEEGRRKKEEGRNALTFRPKLLMCSNSLDFTGAPLHQYEIAVELFSKGIVEPVIFCTTDGPLREVYEQQGMKVIVRDNPLEHIYQRDAYDRAIRIFTKEVDSYNVDVIYVNTLENFFMVDVARELGISSVWNVHESDPWQTYFDRFGPEIAARALECFRFPYQVIFVADATRDRYWQLNSHHNFRVIHNGLDLSRLDRSGNSDLARKSLGVEPGEVMMLLLGTVCDRKGQQDLVKALSYLPEKWHNRIRCFIVGNRPSLYSNKLTGMVSELPEELRQRVSLVSETPETAKYYQAADIFVCTSRVESFPRVILEAMAYDLPIVTTPVFGIREQVRPGINGLFYTPDRPEELAASLLSLLEDESLRHRLAENAKYVLESLNTFEEMTQDYGQIFCEAYLNRKKFN